MLPMVIGWLGLQSVEKVWAAQRGSAEIESARATNDFLEFKRKGWCLL
jgi:hypothetical protein